MGTAKTKTKTRETNHCVSGENMKMTELRLYKYGGKFFSLSSARSCNLKRGIPVKKSQPLLSDVTENNILKE